MSVAETGQSLSPPKAKNQPPESLLQLIVVMAKSIVASLPRIILIGLLMSVLAWVAHTYIIAKVNDGLMYVSTRVAVNSVVRLQQTHFPGISAFWGLLSYFLSSFILRVVAWGPQKWFNNILKMPEHVKLSLTRCKDRSLYIILFGAFIAFVVGAVFRNFMLSWVLAFGIALVMTAHFESLEALVLKVALLDVQRLIKQQFVTKGAEYESIYLALLGLCGGFALVGIWRARIAVTIIVAILLVALFIFMKKDGLQRFAALLVLIGGGLMLLEGPVLAWCEGGSLTLVGGSWTAWWGSNNADLVRRLGLLPAAASFVGGMVGSAVAMVTPNLSTLAGETVASSVGDPGQSIEWEGRSYQEGRSYTFDDGREYRVENGEFVPVRDLKDGERYVDLNGDQRIWVGGQTWYESDWQRQNATNQEYRQAHQEDVARERERRQQEIDQMNREASERAAEIEKQRAEAEQREFAERRAAAERKRDQGIAESKSANRWASFWNVMTMGAEATKYVADKSIDILANVTGPKGRGIRRAYRATSALAGGVGEGMASGNWAESMVEASGEAVGNFIEDSIGSKRTRAGFQVFREGTSNAWQEGKQAYEAGEDVMGAAALGFLEGAADKTSGLVKDSLEGGGKYAYEMAEGAARGGYNALKDGGDAWDVLGGAADGLKDSAIDVVVDYTTGEIIDSLVPETGAVSPEDIGKHQWELFKDDRQDLANQVLDDWIPDYIHDQVRDEIKDKFTEGAQNYVKGDGFDVGLFK